VTEKPPLERARRLSLLTARPQSDAPLRIGQRLLRVPVYDRESLPPGAKLAAPAVVIEYGSTTLIPPDWRAEVDVWRNLILTLAHQTGEPPRTSHRGSLLKLDPC
jgi:N-methylhydantoinase A/oxoprolinase/acetone carboxylase beta subunit